MAIVVEEVIGWDMRTNRSTGKVGFFGVCEALSIAFEEQGRKSIHGHITIHIRGVHTIQEKIFFGNVNEKKLASKVLTKYHEHFVTTNLFNNNNNINTLRKSFEHECQVVDKYKRKLPTVVENDELRMLRHKLGYVQCGGRFAFCSHCNKKWTYEDLVNKYVRHLLDINDEYEEKSMNKKNTEHNICNIPRSRLLGEVISYQRKKGYSGDDTTSLCINAVYNHHYSFHTKGCFKCNKKDKKKHTCGPMCECRMRYPDRSRDKSIVKIHKDGSPWFTWNGEQLVQPIIEVLPRRGTYDLFQNTSCSAISESKMACNTNANVITDGPIGQYMFKYQHKSTQKDDVADYEHVDRAIKNIAEQKHDDDRKEALRLVCRAAFAHNSKNVIGAPLASFLIRNGSRFYFSHTFEYCPLNDLKRLLRNQKVTAVARVNSDNIYFENKAIHYLCRPDTLNTLSAKEFYENYVTVQVSKVKKKRKREEQDLLYKQNTGYFQHCSARIDKNGKIGNVQQSAKEREERTYIKVPQWEFPDTASFKGDILTCSSENINVAMEKYAETVLVLLMPYRSINDFVTKNRTIENISYVEKLREVYISEEEKIFNGGNAKVFTNDNIRFLQNIQNAAYNSMRYKIPSDDLQSVTNPFSQKGICVPITDDTDNEDTMEETNEYMYEQMLADLDSTSVIDDDCNYLVQYLQNFSFSTIRNNGKFKIGYNTKLPIPKIVQSNEQNLLINDIVTYDNVCMESDDVQTRHNQLDIKYSVDDVVELLISRANRRSRNEIFSYNCEEEVIDANGTIISILEWSKAAKLDLRQ